MKKIELLFLLYFTMCWVFNMSAQCTQYDGGPYANQGIEMAGCDGDTLTSFYLAWKNEVYFSDVITGGNYTFELVDCNDMNWGGTVEITAIDGGVNDIPNKTIIGGITTVSTGCSVTFTATNTGTAYFIITTVGDCGTSLLEENNGIPRITTNSGVVCGVCENIICESTENYCSCVQDCLCTGFNPVFAQGYGTGTLVIAPTPVVYCESQVNVSTANPIPEAIYIPFAPFGNQPCVTAWDMSVDFGSLYADVNSSAAIPYTDFIKESFVGLVKLTETDLINSNGIITVMFTDFTTGNGCTFDLVIDMSTAIDAAGNPWSGSVLSACPGVCGAPEGTFLSYDCVESSLTINIVDMGIPSAGSAGFTAEVRTAGGFVISGIPLAIGDIVIPLPDNNQIYDIVYTDGISAGCEKALLSNALLYGDCRQTAGPGSDCSFVMDNIELDGSFEMGTGWIETPMGSQAISTSVPLSGSSHAYLGGYGLNFTTEISQSITIPSLTSVTAHYWLWLVACADATDVFEFTIDGAVLQTLNGSNVNCNGNWFEVSVDISAYADGGTHTLGFAVDEMGSGAGDGFTTVMVDELIIEACNLPCTTDLVLTTAEVGTQTYVAGNSITSTDAVVDNEGVVYDAGEVICLENNFEATTAAGFAAIIDGCLVLLAPDGGHSSPAKMIQRNGIQPKKYKPSKRSFGKHLESQQNEKIGRLEIQSLK